LMTEEECDRAISAAWVVYTSPSFKAFQMAYNSAKKDGHTPYDRAWVDGWRKARFCSQCDGMLSLGRCHNERCSLGILGRLIRDVMLTAEARSSSQLDGDTVVLWQEGDPT
jgi:hypothetical protein